MRVGANIVPASRPITASHATNTPPTLCLVVSVVVIMKIVLAWYTIIRTSLTLYFMALTTATYTWASSWKWNSIILAAIVKR